jgi:hypothetical protein
VQDLKKKAQHRINLFDFARDTISRVTTMLMIGQEAFGSGAFLEEWTALFLEADVEKSFSGPNSAISTMLEVMVFGERRIYQKDRRLLLPLIDKEIQACLDGIQPAHPISALASMVRF